MPAFSSLPQNPTGFGFPPGYPCEIFPASGSLDCSLELERVPRLLGRIQCTFTQFNLRFVLGDISVISPLCLCFRGRHILTPFQGWPRLGSSPLPSRSRGGSSFAKTPLILHYWLLFHSLNHGLNQLRLLAPKATAWVFKQQTFISYSSGSWEGQDQGACRFSVLWEPSPWLAAGCLLAVSCGRGKGERSLLGPSPWLSVSCSVVSEFLRPHGLSVS